MKARLYVASVIGGLALLVIMIVVVLNYGRHDPSPPSLRNHPNPAIPGKVIYVDEDQCIRRVPASGGDAEELYCLSRNEYVSRLFYIDDQTIGFAWSDSRGEILYEVNLTTRAVRDTGLSVSTWKASDVGLVSPSGEEVFSDDSGGVYLLKDGTRTIVAEFDVRDYGGPNPVTWSPDGQWILLRYWGRSDTTELWIVSRDGAIRGTVASDAGGQAAAWYIEGAGSYPPLPETYRR